jgi:hypothetical protein
LVKKNWGGKSERERKRTNLGYDPGSETEARVSVADVATALHLEGEAADLVIRVGERGDDG